MGKISQLIFHINNILYLSKMTVSRKHRRRRPRTSRVQKVVVVKPTRKRRRGPRLGALLSPKKMVKLRYVDTVSINPGAAAVLPHFFSANGIFDPDETGTGQIFLFYLTVLQHYTG